MFGVSISEENNVTCIFANIVTMVHSPERQDTFRSGFSLHLMNVAAGARTTGWIETGFNLDCGLTKHLSKGIREFLFREWTY